MGDDLQRDGFAFAIEEDLGGGDFQAIKPWRGGGIDALTPLL